MPFRHKNGPIILHSHFHNTCILVLYDEIFQDLYVNNGTNSNSPRPYFDQYEHGEPFVSNPVFITWVYMPYATLLCTACDIEKIQSWPIRIRIKKLLEKHSFWAGSSSCIRSMSLIIYMSCYLRPIIVGVMVWYFIFCLFPPLFFMVMMTTKIFLLLLHTFASPKIYSL